MTQIIDLNGQPVKVADVLYFDFDGRKFTAAYLQNIQTMFLIHMAYRARHGDEGAYRLMCSYPVVVWTEGKEPKDRYWPWAIPEQVGCRKCGWISLRSACSENEKQVACFKCHAVLANRFRTLDAPLGNYEEPTELGVGWREDHDQLAGLAGFVLASEGT